MALREADQEHRDVLSSFILECLFTKFDTQRDYLTQLEANMSVLRPILEDAKNKR